MVPLRPSSLFFRPCFIFPFVADREFPFSHSMLSWFIRSPSAEVALSNSVYISIERTRVRSMFVDRTDYIWT